MVWRGVVGRGMGLLCHRQQEMHCGKNPRALPKQQLCTISHAACAQARYLLYGPGGVTGCPAPACGLSRRSHPSAFQLLESPANGFHPFTPLTPFHHSYCAKEQ